ncbi:hypothetical protein LJC00_01710 [Dysgonomonas sp. OttesenSCG-928-M03]|nr:hypothetical protein [Dysgonomonas sp. OttesenSCG-928-M03]
MNANNFTKNYLRFILPLIALSLFLSSCSQDDNFNKTEDTPTPELRVGKQVGDLVVNELSVMLTPASIDKIRFVEENLIIFESEPEQSADIKADAILVGVKSDDNTLKNIMGKVISVNINNGEWYVQMAPVEIEEFIYSGTISGTVYPVLYDDMLRSSSQKLMVVQDIDGFPSYAYLNDGLNKLRASIKLPRIEHDETYSISLPIPIVDIESSLALKAGFTPVFDYNIKFGWKGIEEFNITMYAQEILLDAHLNAYGGLKFDLSVADMYSIPIVPIILGPTGLILSPTVSAGPYVHVKAGTAMDIKLFHVEGDISYILTDPLKMPKFNLSADSYDWSNIQWGGAGAEAEGGLHLSAGFSLTFVATNLASVGASSKIGVGSVVSMPNVSNVNLNIYGNLNADARIVLGIPPLQIEKKFPVVNWNPTIYEKEFATGW